MRANALHNLSVELWPVRNISKETSDVDKIDVVFGKRPVFVHIVNLEFAIWCHPSWLSW